MLICNENEPGDNFQGDQTFREKVKMLILIDKSWAPIACVNDCPSGKIDAGTTVRPY